ncbi:hypothetical protein PMKS-001020 [Pichia membranifaciens]|uniref:Uncharacterized protein n=1 Tax=Pichia membranifaciens TaxID=4926 RepID=A0A1Q2YDE5_9ASCO|nr:hypothetical protein PMKS-001020 [Pichia membranifaciens]
MACSGVSTSVCTHSPVEEDDSANAAAVAAVGESAGAPAIPIASASKPRRGIKPKSILSKKEAGSTSVESHFANSVSFDTVNLKFSDDLNNYPFSAFSDSDDDHYDGRNLSPVKQSGVSADDLDRGRSKMEVPSRRTSSRSPSRSLSPRARSPMSPQLDMISQKEENVFKDMFELYQPSLVIVGAKPGRAAPTKSWATKRISDRIVKTSPVPTIIVSPINMGLYETKFFKLLDKRMAFIDGGSQNTYRENQDILNEIDNAGVYNLEDQREYIRKTAFNDDYILKELNAIVNEKEESRNQKVDLSDDEDTESVSSSSDSGNGGDVESSLDDTDNALDDSSVDSANPPAFVVNTDNTASFKLKRLELETQVVIYKEVAKLESEPLTKDSFKHLLTVVSDAAYKYGVQLAESAKLGGEESQLVRTLTGAPEQLERRKSMVTEALDHDDFDEKLKRFRQQKKLEKQQMMAGGRKRPSIKAPKISIETPSTPKGGYTLRPPKSPISVASNGSSSSSIGSTIDSPLNTGKNDKKKKKKGLFGLFGRK